LKKANYQVIFISTWGKDYDISPYNSFKDELFSGSFFWSLFHSLSLDWYSHSKTYWSFFFFRGPIDRFILFSHLRFWDYFLFFFRGPIDRLIPFSHLRFWDNFLFFFRGPIDRLILVSRFIFWDYFLFFLQRTYRSFDPFFSFYILRLNSFFFSRGPIDRLILFSHFIFWDYFLFFSFEDLSIVWSFFSHFIFWD